MSRMMPDASFLNQSMTGPLLRRGAALSVVDTEPCLSSFGATFSTCGVPSIGDGAFDMIGFVNEKEMKLQDANSSPSQ